MKNTKTPFPKSKKLVKPEDGTIAYTWDGKLHNWDGPALLPEGKKNTQNIIYMVLNILRMSGVKLDNKEKDYLIIKTNQ